MLNCFDALSILRRTHTRALKILTGQLVEFIKENAIIEREKRLLLEENRELRGMLGSLYQYNNTLKILREKIHK
jgi:hypothetical protein